MSHSSHSVYTTCRSGPNLEPSQRIQGSHGILHLLKESSSDSLQILLVKLRQWSAHSLHLWGWNRQGKVFRSNCEGSSLRSLRLLVESQNIWERGCWSTCRTTTRLAQDRATQSTRNCERAGFRNRHVLQVKRVLGYRSAAVMEQPESASKCYQMLAEQVSFVWQLLLLW